MGARRKVEQGSGIVLIIVLIIAALLFSGKLQSFIGSAAGSKFLYVNTYIALNDTQLPAGVSYTYTANHGVGTISGSCQTQIELFNPGVFVAELDAPINGSYPIFNAYYSPSLQNKQLAICMIYLPTNQYSTTIGNLSISAAAIGYRSGSYTTQINIASNYSTNGANPIIITIPLVPTSPQTTSLQTTSIVTTSVVSSASTSVSTTMNSTSTSATTSVLISTTTISTPGNLNITRIIGNPISDIIRSLINLIKSLLHIK